MGPIATRLFLVYAATLHLKNITLSNGFSNTGDGGAIYNNGVLTLDNTTISDSNVSSNFSGGAIVNYGPLTINDSLFENNVGGNGGALYLRFENGDATISGTTFRNNRTTNTSTSGWGGAILLWGADVTIRSSTFEQNVARNGGAIHNSFANTVMTLEANTVLRGNAAADLAGGIYNENGSSLMTNVTIGENTAQVGGGIVNRGNITLSQVTVSGNSANVGGGIRITESSPLPK